MKHTEIKARKMAVVNRIVKDVKVKGVISLNDMYKSDATVYGLWSTGSYFVNDIKKLAPSSVVFEGKPKQGTVIKPATESDIVHRVEMGGLFPCVYNGIVTNHPIDGMEKMDTCPKMLKPFVRKYTKVYRGVDANNKVNYMTVRKDGRKVLYSMA